MCFYLFQGVDIRKAYNLIHIRRRVFRSSLATENSYILKLLNIPHNSLVLDFLPRLEEIFEDVLSQIVETYGKKNTRMVLLIENYDLNNPICLPLAHLNTYSGKYIVNSIAAVLQSRSNLRFSSSFNIRCGVVHYAKVFLGGRNHMIDINPMNNYNSIRRKNKSLFFTPFSDDGQCLLRSITYALKFKEKGQKYAKRIYDKPQLLDKEARELANRYGIEWGKNILSKM